MREGFFRPVFTLSYVSRSRLDHLSMGGRSQIDDILRVSRERNRLLNITGALFFNEGRFIFDFFFFDTELFSDNFTDSFFNATHFFYHPPNGGAAGAAARVV